MKLGVVSAGSKEYPTTIVTFVGSPKDGARLVRGTATDNGTIRRVVVNGREARALAPGLSEWEVTIDNPKDGILTAHAEDDAGNIESDPHCVHLVTNRPAAK